MSAELAKKRIASYMRGDITKAELDEFINSFGDELTEEAYSEYLEAQFEKFIAENKSEIQSENSDASEKVSPTKEKKSKSAQLRRFMNLGGIAFCWQSTFYTNIEIKYWIIFISFLKSCSPLKN